MAKYNPECYKHNMSEIGEYDDDNNEFSKPCKFTHSYSKQSLFDANKNIKPFIQDWLVH